MSRVRGLALAMASAAMLLPLDAAGGQSLPSVPGSAEFVDVISTDDDAHRRLTVEVAVNGYGPLRFMVDTAAERTVLSHDIADKLGLVENGTITLHSMTGAAIVDSVFVRGLRFSAQHIGGIRAPLLSRSHMAAAGILGLDSLRGQHVFLDFAREVMTIMPGEQKLPYAPTRQTIGARDVAGRLVITDASIAGMPIYVIVDTGSPITIGNRRMRSLVKARAMAAAFRAARITSVTGETIETDYGLIDEVRLGDIKINNMESAFADLYIFRHLGLDDRPALLLGMDSMRLFDQVSIDFATRKVRFLMRGHSRRDAPLLMAALVSANGD